MFLSCAAYKKANLTTLMKRQLQREIEIQSGLDHRNVLQLFGAFEVRYNSREYYLLM